MKFELFRLEGSGMGHEVKPYVVKYEFQNFYLLCPKNRTFARPRMEWDVFSLR